MKIRKSIALILALVMALCLFETVTAEESIPTVTIDVSQRGEAVSRGLLGCNHRVNNNGEGIWDPVNNEVFPDFTKTYLASGITSFRYPGGTVGNYFEWKKGIGDRNERLAQISKGGQVEVSLFGVDEACNWAETVNSTLVYMYNFANGSAADAAALVYY